VSHCADCASSQGTTKVCTAVAGTPLEEVETTCDDGVDNDCDGSADSADPTNCAPSCTPSGGLCDLNDPGACCSLTCTNFNPPAPPRVLLTGLQRGMALITAWEGRFCTCRCSVEYRLFLSNPRQCKISRARGRLTDRNALFIQGSHVWIRYTHTGRQVGTENL
jgi:hypothetical protein